jgi:nucleotide-binding universal stress UspA family protein
MYMMARDGEMPRPFTRLSQHGVPWWPLLIAVGLPVVVLISSADFESLAGLYAIGVVGAIVLNLGSCTFNWALPLHWLERSLFAFTFLILFAVELTLAHEKHDALFFVMCVLILGLGLRQYAQRRSGMTTLTVTQEVAQMVTPDLIAKMQPRLEEGQKIMVAARGLTPVLRFALDEAQLRHATLCVLYVKEIAVHFAGPAGGLGRARWQDDPEANAIMSLMLKLGEERGVPVLPVYAVSEDAAAAILDLSATLGVDYLLIGASQRNMLAHLLRGSVVTSVVQQLPDTIELVIHG